MLYEPIETRLPRGLFGGDGACHRAAVLRPLTGWQEARLAARPPRAADVSALLAACLERVGDLEALPPRRVAELTRGDRDHLLLCLRRAALGPTLHLTVRCARPDCQQPAAVQLALAALLDTPGRAPGGAHLTVETAAGPALLREPTGEDDALLETLPPDEQADLLWSRLVLRLGSQGSLTPAAWRALPAALRHQLACGLDAQRTGPRLEGVLRCPACGAQTPWALSAAALLSAELRPGVARLPEEVHALAWHYGWSEADVMALPRQRRWHYLGLLARALQPEEAPAP